MQSRHSAEPGGRTTDFGERERAILDFERQWWRHAGAKEQAVRDRFGLSANRYYQVLNAVIDHPEAMAHAPVVVNRLRRLRSARRRARMASRGVVS
ncbi:MAG: DUF3263 domain-containing protein [Actinomycetota bacterium]